VLNESITIGAKIIVKDCHLVMNNVAIHKPEKIAEEMNKKGYRATYLLPYSPFLNPIKKFWVKIKALL
jgi:transposase